MPPHGFEIVLILLDSGHKSGYRGCIFAAVTFIFSITDSTVISDRDAFMAKREFLIEVAHTKVSDDF